MLNDAEYAARFDAPLTRSQVRRLHQVHRYLVAHWPSKRGTRMVVRKIEPRKKADRAYAYVIPAGPRLLIVVDTRMQFGHALDSLLHEWAHCVVWDVREDDHGAAWAAKHSEIATAFNDGDALEDSREW